MQTLKAAPGRILLRFPPPVEEMRGGIVIPQTSAQRPEFGEIHDIGEATNPAEERLVRFFSDLKAAGKKIAVSFAAGTSFWQQNYDPNVYGWVRDYRAFRLSEISAYLVEGE